MFYYQSVIQEALQQFRAVRMTQLAQGLGFNLADTFAGNIKLPSYFFQRMKR